MLNNVIFKNLFKILNKIKKKILSLPLDASLFEQICLFPDSLNPFDETMFQVMVGRIADHLPCCVSIQIKLFTNFSFRLKKTCEGLMTPRSRILTFLAMVKHRAQAGRDTARRPNSPPLS